MGRQRSHSSMNSPIKTAIKVALIALLWITAIDSGTLGTIDTELRLQMAHAWWTGTQEVDPNYQPTVRGDLSVGVIGVGGKRYIAYEVGQSMLMLPGDWLGTQLHQWFPKVWEKYFRSLVVNFAIFVPLNVAAVVSCFWLLRLFDFDERMAGLATITWLLSTTVFHYAQVPQQNNQVLLFVTVGYAAALACVRQNQLRFALFSGLALGAAVLIRITSMVHVATVFMFIIGCIAYQSRDKFKVLKVGGLWIVGFMPLALLGRLFDYLRYGSFWTTGQSLGVKQLNSDPIFASFPELPANFPLINPPHLGIWGVLFSPAKSIFIYDPLLLPCLVLGIVLWKKLSPYMQWYLITGMFNLLLHIVITSRLNFWHGDSAWGARYHVTSVHLLLIPLIALFIQHLGTAKKLISWLMRGILTVAIIVQIASVIMPFTLEDAQAWRIPPSSAPIWRSELYLHFRLGQRFTNIGCLIDSSFSDQCISRLSPGKTKSFLSGFNKVMFLPFNYAKFGLNRKWAFVVWGLVLTMAIWTTLWLGFLGQEKVTG